MTRDSAYAGRMSDTAATLDEALHLAADEELALARCLSWRELRDHVPYGDTYQGFDTAGGEVEFERAYLWKSHEGGDILCEVTVRRPGRNGAEVRVGGLICEGGCND